MSSIVTSKGRVTIPKPIRDRLGITAGAAVAFMIDRDGRVILTRADSVTRPTRHFEHLRGVAGEGMTTDDVMALTRGEG